MTTPPDHEPHQSRAGIRTDARLDAATRAKVDDLAWHFHRPRAAVLSYIMTWGLSRGQMGPFDQGEAQGPVRHLHLSVDSALHAGVAQAAAAAGVKMAPWLRHWLRQISVADFPASWQDATPGERSHDSRVYATRFMLRLDGPHRPSSSD